MSGFPGIRAALPFVTPTYVTAQSDGLAGELPGIARVTRNPVNGAWEFTQILSTPRFFYNGSFRPAALTQIYPAISPSGVGLAYFDLFFPDVLGGTQPVTARLIRANANGSGAQILAEFNQGFYPLGLSWSRDGTQLVFSIAQQFQSSAGFFPSAIASTAVIRQIPSSGGAITQVPGIDTGFFPSAPTVPLLPLGVSSPSDTTPPTLRVRGSSRIQTLRPRVVLRGTINDGSAISRLAVNARGAKVRKSKILRGNRFKVVLAIKKPRGRVIVKLRAIDAAGNRSRPAKVRILRR